MPFARVGQVRRGALLTLNCLAHNKPLAIRELLPILLPLLYEETAKRPELIHQVTRPPVTFPPKHSLPALPTHRPL